MHLLSWHRPGKLVLRRAIVAVMLVSYCTTAVGIAIPVRVDKPGDAPFPCQHHACGCLTAEQCRDHCCCYSAGERLAWTRERGLDASAALVAAAAAETHHRDDHDSEHAELPGCCAHRAAEAAFDDHCTAATGAAACRASASEPQTRVVLGISAAKCRAISSLWCASGAVLVPPAVCWQFQWNVVEWISPLAASGPMQDLSPPVPPPRV